MTPSIGDKVRQLNGLAAERGQTMAEMALAWALRDKRVTSLIVGARNVAQLQDNLKALENTSFSQEQLGRIDGILGDVVM